MDALTFFGKTNSILCRLAQARIGRRSFLASHDRCRLACVLQQAVNPLDAPASTVTRFQQRTHRDAGHAPAIGQVANGELNHLIGQ